MVITFRDNKSIADIIRIVFCKDVIRGIFIVKDDTRKKEINALFELMRYNLDKMIRNNLRAYCGKQIDEEKIKKRNIISIKTICIPFTYEDEYNFEDKNSKVYKKNEERFTHEMIELRKMIKKECK